MAVLLSRISNIGVHNFSSKTLTFAEKELMGNNLKFISAVNKKDYAQTILLEDITNFKKNVFNKINYLDSSQEGYIPKLYVRKTYDVDKLLFVKPSDSTLTKVLKTQVGSFAMPDFSERKFRHEENLTKHQRKLLSELLRDESLTFKAADKNLGLVIMDTKVYNDNGFKMLDDKKTYELIVADTVKSTCEAIRKYIKILLKQLLTFIQNNIESTVRPLARVIRNFILSSYFDDYQATKDKSFKLPVFYLLPKIHKTPIGWRPIVPSHSWITAPFSQIIDYCLQSTIEKVQVNSPIIYDDLKDPGAVPTIIKDTKSLINIMEQIIVDDPECYLITSDVTSLYTNIPIDEGIKAISRLQEIPLKNQIVGMLSKVLYCNIFEFEGKYYRQIEGTAMGTACAPAYANLYVRESEVQIIWKYRKYIRFYGRYIDDIFIVLTSDINIKDFQRDFQQMNKFLEFSFELSQKEAIFLDICFFKGNRFKETRVLDTKVHQKEVNQYLYLPFSSSHPTHTKKGFIKTELQRYIRITNNLEDYCEIKRMFFERLRVRGFPSDFLLPIFNSIFFKDRNKYKEEHKSVEKSLDSRLDTYFPLVFSPVTQQMSDEIKASLRDFAQATTLEIRKVNPTFPEIRPILCWRSSPNFGKLFTTKSRYHYMASKTDEHGRVRPTAIW